MTALRRPPFPKRAVFFGLSLFVVFSLLFQFVDWDQQAAAYYAAQGWPGRGWPWAQQFYLHGEQLSVIVGALGAIFFALSFVTPRFRAARGTGLYLGLLLILGPGLLVNGLAKALAGRPRPTDCIDFGGLWSFARPFHFGTPGQGVSFLSGHAAAAWYFFGLFWVLRGPRRWISLLATLAYGGLMSLARVSQGAHWLSDTVLCGAALFTLAAALSPLLHWQPSQRLWSRPGLGWALTLGVLAWLSLGAVRYEDRRYLLVSPNGEAYKPKAQERLVACQALEPATDVAVDLDLPASDLRLVTDDGKGFSPVRFDSVFQGQGLPGAAQALDLQCPPQPNGGTLLHLTVQERLRGFWLRARGQAELSLQRDLGQDLRLHLSQGTLTIAPFPAGRRVLLSRLPEGSIPPAGFAPYEGTAWLREGSLPLIAIDIQAPSVRFE